MGKRETKNLSERDRRHLWHPLTQHKTHPGMLGLVKASGNRLFDEHGNTYIDGIASWYTTMYGHCNPAITEPVAEQMRRLDQVVFSGFTHEPAVALSEALMAVLPANQDKLFFSDNGSTAVEVAVKMALQFHVNRGQRRNRILALEDGFHGDTFGAMSVSGLSVYNGPFEEYFLEVDRIPVPTADNLGPLLSDLDERLGKGDVAAFVYEPLVQGAAAMRMHRPQDLEPLIRLARKHGVLCIADEVMTGFGKTGRHFASDHMGVAPDMICLSKALTAGLLPMAVTSCTREVYDAFYHDDRAKGFFHGHTYTANPLACTAALAALGQLCSDPIQERIANVSRQHSEFARGMALHEKVAATRHLGVIVALDLAVPAERYGALRDRLYRFYMEQGVFLRPLGNTVYILAPFTITDSELSQLYAAVEASLEIL